MTSWVVTSKTGNAPVTLVMHYVSRGRHYVLSYSYSYFGKKTTQFGNIRLTVYPGGKTYSFATVSQLQKYLQRKNVPLPRLPGSSTVFVPFL